MGIYLLVPPDFTLQAFHGVAHSMLLKPERQPTGTRGVDYCERWSDQSTIVEWLEVGMLECCFVWFVSSDPVSTQASLVHKLNAVPVEELVKQASSTQAAHNELVHLLYRIGYMSTDPDESVIALFEKCLTDSRPTIRRAALNGYMIRRWPELWERIREIELSDEIPEVRETARRVLDLGVGTNTHDNPSPD